MKKLANVSGFDWLKIANGSEFDWLIPQIAINLELKVIEIRNCFKNFLGNLKT